VSLIIVTLAGSFGYYLISDGRWDFIDCLYMTLITISTVGYREAVDIQSVPSAKIYTMVLIVAGMAAWLFFLTSLTAFLVEGEILQVFRRKRMTNKLNRIKNHMVVCGAGQTGYHSIVELVQMGEKVVAIDKDQARLERLDDIDVFTILGDATDEKLLIQAGVKKARGLIATLSDDAANLFVTISARELNPNIRIIARAVDPNTMEKLEKVGANSAVSPNRIGGLRMASELLRPTVITFLDHMVRTPGSSLRMEEVPITDDSPFKNHSLKDSNIRELANLLVVAVKDPASDRFVYNPGPDYVLRVGEVLVVLGRVEDAKKLKKLSGQETRDS